MDFAAKDGYAWKFGVYALVIAVFIVPMLGLEFYGKRIGNRLGCPMFEEDLWGPCLESRGK